MSKFKKIIITLLCLLIIIPLCVFGYAYFKLGSIHEETDYSSKIEAVKGITNILLTGTDARPGETASRTDSMMILTIDNVNKSVKLTSLARDTYVQLPGRNPGKLNTAYFWGKEPMLFETIENEFGIGIDKIVQVDFNALMDIVDTLGGVDVNVPENNIGEINKYAKESYKIYNSPNKGEFKEITTAGKQTLNGYQALSFARVRKVDSAICRDQRQQEVLTAIAEKVKSMPVTKYPKLLNSILPYVKTNIDSNEILKLGVTILGILDSGNEIKTANFPITDEIHSKGGVYNGAGWVWLYDKNSTVVLQDFIYKDIDMEDNDYLKDNSNIQLNY
ncbi:MAG: LCP family protein [Terrisporobacter othiniensis]|uniref:LCP family protein n=1 Tax=Terrisporobacter othiniensis TaxID=1577792 RepID=UPI0009437065|nr:LCP family protein [Terrisporobacter othiniensis]MDY3373277.1 LCP family protein [Terrisporobacter othiniensis]